MSEAYQPPPNQPKWLLRLQVWLLRHRLMGLMGKQFMVITTTGRKSGKQYSVPIGYVRDGADYLAFNIMDHSNWLKNARVHPEVSLNIKGREIPVIAHEIKPTTPEEVRALLRIYQREQPKQTERFFKATADSPDDKLMPVAQAIWFVRFVPVTNQTRMSLD